MIAMQMMHLPDDSAYEAAGGNPRPMRPTCSHDLTACGE